MKNDLITIFDRLEDAKKQALSMNKLAEELANKMYIIDEIPKEDVLNSPEKKDGSPEPLNDSISYKIAEIVGIHTETRYKMESVLGFLREKL